MIADRSGALTERLSAGAPAHERRLIKARGSERGPLALVGCRTIWWKPADAQDDSRDRSSGGPRSTRRGKVGPRPVGQLVVDSDAAVRRHNANERRPGEHQ